MSPKWHVISAILGIGMLAVPAYAANQRRPQPPVTKPPAAAFHSAPAPVFHPPRQVAMPPRVAYHQPPPAPSPRLPFNQPPVRSFQPPRPAFHPALLPPAPRFGVNQRVPARPLPPARVVSVPPLHRVTPPVHATAPRPAGNLAYVPRDRWDYQHRDRANVWRTGRQPYTQPYPGLICDGDGDRCRPAPQVVCDGDGDDCRQVPYNYQQYGYGYPPTYYQPAYNYQQAYAPYYNHPEPDGDDFNAYYLPYQAPPVVCDEDGDDCGPAPYFNAPYQAWAPLPPLPVPVSPIPVYYADPNIMRLRSRLIWMDQAARARYLTAVAHQQARQARHLFHVTRSLDGQLARLDGQARRTAAVQARYASAIR